MTLIRYGSWWAKSLAKGRALSLLFFEDVIAVR